MSKQQCAGQVLGGRHFHNCSRWGTLEHEGRMWCKTHHPPTEKERSEARYKKFREQLDAETKARVDKNHRAACFDDLVSALEQCLRIVDAHRRVSGGEGDIAAMNAREALAKARGQS